MSENQTHKFTLVIVGLVVLLLFLSIGWVFDHRNMERQLAQQIENAHGKDTIIKRWKDEAEREHVIAEARQVSLQELKTSNDETIKKLRKEVSDLKNLVSRIGIITTTSGTVGISVHDTIFVKDSSQVQAQTFGYSDKWLSFYGTIINKELDLSYGIKNDLTIDTKWEREKFWKPKKLHLEIINNNPNTTVNRVQTIYVSSPPKKWYERVVVVAPIAFAGGFIFGALR